MMLARTLSRPRWAMAMTIDSMPCVEAFSMARSSSGMRLSAPSSEKLLAPTNLRRMNSSKITASVKPREDADLLVAGKLQAVLRFFHPPLQPLPHFQVVDVHELGADRPAIGIAKPVHDVAERLRVRTGQRVGRELAIEIGFGKPPELRFQFRRHGPRNAQRIDLGDQVPPDPVVADQQVDAFLQSALGMRFPRAIAVDRGPAAVSPLPRHAPQVRQADQKYLVPELAWSSRWPRSEQRLRSPLPVVVSRTSGCPAVVVRRTGYRARASPGPGCSGRSAWLVPAVRHRCSSVPAEQSGSCSAWREAPAGGTDDVRRSHGPRRSHRRCRRLHADLSCSVRKNSATPGRSGSDSPGRGRKPARRTPNSADQSLSPGIVGVVEDLFTNPSPQSEFQVLRRISVWDNSRADKACTFRRSI